MKRRNPFAPVTYTFMHELMAAPDQPLQQDKRRHQLTMMWEGLRSLETAPEPRPNDWRLVSDAINLMETFVKNGPWSDCKGDPVEVHDCNGLLYDAVAALAVAGAKHMEGKTLRLDGPGIQATRAVLEDYADLLDVLPARTVIQCHRKTERRIRKIMAGIKESHDIEVMPL
jgi:mRNA-degrading endonuclease YafQ of YafQ-DinJ toxin-antitoxin module